MESTSVFALPVPESSNTVRTMVLESVVMCIRSPKASPMRDELRSTREVCTPEPSRHVAYSAMKAVISFSSSVVLIGRLSGVFSPQR